MSDNYIVSARKYRPSSFATVVGQPNLTSTLKGAISSGRLAHAYLFCGPRGVGKTSCARIFAKTINCLNPTPDGEACGECESCRAIDKGNSFNLVELDAASNNGVDNIRAINEQVAIPPQVGKYRVFIIDEVHMLSSGAFNAFLKTLEEPPSYAVFILATTEKHKVLPTILSRCQIYDFKRITVNDITAHLGNVAAQEGIKADPRALGVIARKADGAMRDALSIFDQVAASGNGELSYEATISNLNVLDYEYFFRLVDTFASGDAPQALLLFKEIRDRGFDPLFFINSLAQHVRDLMVAADARTVSLLETSSDIEERMRQQASSLPLPWYYAAMKILNDCDLNYRASSNKQLLTELTLIRLCQLLNPAQPPFDQPDRSMPLRDPATTPGPQNSQSQSPAPGASSTTAATTSIATSAASSSPNTDAEQRPRRPRSFSLNASGSKSSGGIEKKRAPFSDAELQNAWKEYASEVPAQKILTGALLTSTPRRIKEEEFEAVLDHPAQVQACEGAMPKLVEYLRTHLANDYITVKVSLNPEKETSKYLSPRDFLKKTAEVNPRLGEFLKSLDPELA